MGELAQLGRLRGPVVGIDPSTKRMAACIIEPVGMLEDGRWVSDSTREPWDGPRSRAVWVTRTLPEHTSPALRHVMAADVLSDMLARIEADHGLPLAVGLEIPYAGTHTPLVSFYIIGALLVAMGDAWGARVPLVEWSAGGWKAPATGSGGTRPKGESKTARRRREKARVVTWAQDVLGYRGTVDDEADAAGVAVATGLRCLTERKYRRV